MAVGISLMLLDTCALLWLEHAKLSRQVLTLLEESPAVYVSAATGFEIAVKYRTGKLSLPVSPSEWFEGIINYHDLTVIDITLPLALKAAELPPHHRDPFDRFIIAAAIAGDIPVVTADKIFELYGVKTVI